MHLTERPGTAEAVRPMGVPGSQRVKSHWHTYNCIMAIEAVEWIRPLLLMFVSARLYIYSLSKNTWHLILLLSPELPVRINSILNEVFVRKSPEFHSSYMKKIYATAFSSHQWLPSQWVRCDSYDFCIIKSKSSHERTYSAMQLNELIINFLWKLLNFNISTFEISSTQQHCLDGKLKERWRVLVWRPSFSIWFVVWHAFPHKYQLPACSCSHSSICRSLCH